MNGIFTLLLLGAVASLLAIAAVGDLRSRTIPNWLTGAIALLALPYWWSLGLPLWPEVAMQLGVALAMFLLFALLFQLGAMGGGDVKLIAALSLWLPLGAVLGLLVVMSLAGGVLTLAMLARQRLAKSGRPIEVPYGVAIVFAGFWVLAEPFLNQFA